MKKILITGHEGFIGGCLLRTIGNQYKIIASDYIRTGKVKHDCRDPDTLGDLSNIDVVIHLGAISSTNSINQENIFQKNIINTLNIFEKAKNAKIIYASSASVYGCTKTKVKETDPLHPQSLYARSKSIIDEIVVNYLTDRQIVGLRFFNVCSFYSENKKLQPSPTYKFLRQLENGEPIKLFFNSENILRDFIYIEDVIKIINFFINYQISESTLVNVGSGKAVSFEQIADKIIKLLGGSKEYIKKPGNILNSYQEYTEADISYLRSLGYDEYIPTIIEHIDKRFNGKHTVAT